MTDQEAPAASPLPEVGRVTLGELWICLKEGFVDFLLAPQYGLAFSAVYVVGGFLLVWLGAGTVSWTLTISHGFPLVAPFAAVGLYEVSRRIEAGLPLEWKPVLAVVWQERTRQIPWIGAIIVIYLLFWTFLAHMIFAVFMGLSTAVNVSSSFEMFLTPEGIRMVAAEIIVGAALAYLLFAMTLVSLPLLLEKEIDFVTAMILSVRTVSENFVVLTIWALIIAVLSVLALAPWFLGLMIVLPILGHATWHLYRRALYDPV